jgi:hypothetical protein
MYTYAVYTVLFVCIYSTTLFQYLRLYSVDFYSILIRLPSSSKAGETRVRNTAEFCTYRARRVLLHAVNLRHGTEGRRATDFITIKIHRPRPGLNPRTFGPVASTLTTRPPKATIYTWPLSVQVLCSRLCLFLSYTTL